jgi:hypothetical protein
MTFNINEFKSNVLSRGVAKTSKFFVDISRPADLQRDIRFLCDTATLPGVAFQSSEIRQSGYGNIDSVPYVTTFEQLQLSFIVDSEGAVYKYFHEWVSSIVNFDEYGSSDTTTVPHSLYAFPNTYHAVITITHLNEALGEIVEYKLYKAYPINLGSISVAWSETGIAKLPVSFAYNSWSSKYLNKGQNNNNANSQTGTTLRTAETGTVTLPLPPTRPANLAPNIPLPPRVR